MATIEIGTIEQHHLLFDNTNANWNRQPEYNFAYIKATAQYLQHKLAVRNFLFVNEVLEAFGFEWTADGQVSGWIRSEGYIVIEADPVEGTSDFIIKFAPQGVIVNNI